MRIDEETWTVEPMPYMHWRVYVDGVEIRGVKYLDTEAGWVLSYCPLQDADAELLRTIADYDDTVYPQYAPHIPEALRYRKYVYRGRLNLVPLLPKHWELATPESDDDAIGRIFRGRVEVLPPAPEKQ